MVWERDIYNVVVLEDENILQERMVSIFRDWPLCKNVIGFSSNIDFLKYLSKNTVDILLADLNLDDGNSVASIAVLTKKHPSSIAIVISSLSDGPSVISALVSGAVGYLHKDDHSLSIIANVNKALLGESPMSPSIATTLVASINNRNVVYIKSAPPTIESDLLTPREVEVIRLIAKGCSYDEAAVLLGISKNTIPVHIRNIYRKLQSKNKVEALFEARQLGIIL